MHSWKIGDWCTYNNELKLVVKVQAGCLWLCNIHGEVSLTAHCDTSYIKRHPDCTGWDWKPTQAPEGYRLLEPHEIPGTGSQWLRAADGRWREFIYGRSCNVQALTQDGTILAVAAPENTAAMTAASSPATRHRPFRNAGEFSPHRDRWVARAGDQLRQHGHWRVMAFSDALLIVGNIATTYEDALQQYQFSDDGSPFGTSDTESPVR